MIWSWAVVMRVIASFLIGCTLPILWGGAEGLVQRLPGNQSEASDQVGCLGKAFLFIFEIGSTMGGILLCLWIGTDLRATRVTLLAFLVGGAVVRWLRREI